MPTHVDFPLLTGIDGLVPRIDYDAFDLSDPSFDPSLPRTGMLRSILSLTNPSDEPVTARGVTLEFAFHETPRFHSYTGWTSSGDTYLNESDAWWVRHEAFSQTRTNCDSVLDECADDGLTFVSVQASCADKLGESK